MSHMTIDTSLIGSYLRHNPHTQPDTTRHEPDSTGHRPDTPDSMQDSMPDSTGQRTGQRTGHSPDRSDMDRTQIEHGAGRVGVQCNHRTVRTSSDSPDMTGQSSAQQFTLSRCHKCWSQGSVSAHTKHSHPKRHPQKVSVQPGDLATIEDPTIQ